VQNLFLWYTALRPSCLEPTKLIPFPIFLGFRLLSERIAHLYNTLGYYFFIWEEFSLPSLLNNTISGCIISYHIIRSVLAQARSQGGAVRGVVTPPEMNWVYTRYIKSSCSLFTLRFSDFAKLTTFNFLNLFFYAESESVNNSYQWKSPFEPLIIKLFVGECFF